MYSIFSMSMYECSVCTVCSVCLCMSAVYVQMYVCMYSCVSFYIFAYTCTIYALCVIINYKHITISIEFLLLLDKL